MILSEGPIKNSRGDIAGPSAEGQRPQNSNTTVAQPVFLTTSILVYRRPLAVTVAKPLGPHHITVDSGCVPLGATDVKDCDVQAWCVVRMLVETQRRNARKGRPELNCMCPSRRR
jgi:hypothetical protein